MSKLIEMDDLDKIAGYCLAENDPDLCECGQRKAGECALANLCCPMMTEPPDERFPSAQERWHLGY